MIVPGMLDNKICDFKIRLKDKIPYLLHLHLKMQVWLKI